MKVLFVCSGGMSSAIVVEALKKEAAKKGRELEVKAIGTNEVEQEISNGWSVCMVAPQIRHRFDQVKEQAVKVGVPCGQIPPQAYTPMGGPKLLQAMDDILN
ncbi:PTS sugar transporter subunit IIB [Pontibacillus litoralis]|uniref:PTS cellobiose transporter subunit IIB n=1 Tax=Pontibacillus litoralis JSM 072002 TaxID=1385512 RepID=A0A0A5FV20_9BACI|nr:PTS sugar transporter subunit IIB [Pontibacillus litoralis]KGX84626.1 PTS cellobiose transporter subunit IIB [Pontibacillus litoralis JSM 072002]